jgi:hypothetical protein
MGNTFVTQDGRKIIIPDKLKIEHQKRVKRRIERILLLIK